jgi:hypothetical protein
MIVQLNSLKFDVVAGGAGALLLRKDAATLADPEAVAFAMIPTAGQTLTVTADFTVSDPEGPGTTPTAWIRARALDPAHAVLGHVKEQQIALPPSGGNTGPVQMTLDQPAFHQKGVGRYDVLWTWQVRVEGSTDWIVFQQTHHLAFITLDVPGAPWTQDQNPLPGRSWPWTRALEAACSWASAVKPGTNLNTARKKVSKRVEAAVYAFGDTGLVQYGPSASLVVGTDPETYDVSKFLAVVEGTADSLPLSMNCTDCAFTVAVFANLLGAGSSVLRVEREPGNLHVNDVKLIGNKNFSSMFDYHFIAVRGLNSNAQVFDATLQPDWDVTAAGQDFKLTQGRRRGPKDNTGGTGYLQRLLEPGQDQWDEFTLVPWPMPGL